MAVELPSDYSNTIYTSSSLTGVVIGKRMIETFNYFWKKITGGSFDPGD
jgi:hypothetical protein